jgi:hypothetical protein
VRAVIDVDSTNAALPSASEVTTVSEVALRIGEQNDLAVAISAVVVRQDQHGARRVRQRAGVLLRLLGRVAAAPPPRGHVQARPGAP